MNKKKLSIKETIAISSMLFGMFFGAGNLIFPVHMGQLAGSNVWPAIIGFIITGVGIPILAVSAIGITHSDGLQALASKTGKAYGYIFTCLLYLTIGPLFAIPRCATTSFTVGVSPMLGADSSQQIPLVIFSVVFFALVLFFSLRPSQIITWIGKVINPLFLVTLIILIIVAMIDPSVAISEVSPDASYASNAVMTGFLEGYNTMDAIAGLAFGIVVINVLRDTGISNDNDVAKSTLKCGAFAGLLMAVIYILTTVMGTQSRGIFEVSENGGIALFQIANHYMGTFGSILLALTITFACLKTAIGLVTSCSETFVKMFPGKLNYNVYAIIFSVFSLIISNVGLTALISYSIPLLMLLYPLAIVLTVLAFLDKLFDGAKVVYVCTTIGAFLAAFLDFVKMLPWGIDMSFASKIVPLYDLGLGWLIPSVIGFVIGVIIHKTGKKQAAA